MNQAECVGCGQFYANDGMLVRHLNRQPYCAKAYDAHAVRANDSSDVNDASEADSLLVARVLAEGRVEEAANKRARLDDEQGASFLFSDADSETSQADADAEQALAEDEDAEIELGVNWGAQTWLVEPGEGSDEEQLSPMDLEEEDEEEEEKKETGGVGELNQEEPAGVAQDVDAAGNNLNEEDMKALLDSFQGIFVSHQEHQKKHFLSMSEEEKAAIRLLKLLKKAKAPLYIYKDIVKWATKAAINGVFTDLGGNKLPSRSQMLKNVATRFNMEGLAPKTSLLHLPNANVSIKVTKFDTEAVLLNMLSDPAVFTEENMQYFNRDNPMEPPPEWDTIDKSKHTLGDINTGRRFHDTYHLRCTYQGRHFLLALLIFQDKTHHDNKGNLCSEPLLLGFAGLNYSTRMNPDAWRPLGFIPNQAVHPVAKHPEGKISDVHVVMEFILKDLIELQRKGIRWRIPHKKSGGYIDVVLQIPIQGLIGDNEGLDKIVGHFTNRTNVAGVCRKCKVPLNKTGDPDVRYPPWKQQDISEMIEQKDVAGLKAASHYLLSHGNAYKKADFGSCECGANGSSPADTMHTRRHGLIPYWKTGHFGMLRLAPNGRSVMAPTVVEDLPGHVLPPTSQALDKTKVYSASMVSMVEHIFLFYGRELTHQSDRNIYRTYFPQGLTKVTKINAHEQPGTLLDIVLMLCSKFGRHWFESPEANQPVLGRNKGLMGTGRLSDQIFIAEELLLLDELCRADLPCDFVEGELPLYMPGMVERYNRAVNRQVGMGMDFLKNHAQLHLAEEILDHGSARNQDSELGEAAHKTVLKAPAQNTQQRSSLLDSQTALRYYEGLLIDRASREIDKAKPVNSLQVAGDPSTAKPLGRSFKATADGLFSVGKTPAKALWPDKMLQNQLEQLFHGKILPCLEDEEVELYNTCKINDVTYRADAKYFTGRGVNEGWHDWAYIKRGTNGGEVPAHIMCFAQLRTFKKPLSVMGCETEAPGLYAICHSLTGPLQSALATGQPHPECRIIMTGRKACTTKTIHRSIVHSPELFLFPVDDIVGPCIGVPDVEYVLKQTKKDKLERKNKIQPAADHSFLFVMPRDKWVDTYIQHIVDSPDNDD
jgi:hypothetical protein